MAQTYNVLLATGLIKLDRATINDNFEAVASNFSGNAFPTNNLVSGMFCFREDSRKLYCLQPDLTTWQLLADFSSGVTYVAKANSADNAIKAQGDSNGKDLTEYIAALEASDDGYTITVTNGAGKVVNTITIPKIEYSIFTGATASAAGKSGLVPAPSVGDKAKFFLSGDGTWKEVDLPVMTGATASAAGRYGFAPTPAAGAQNYFLRGDGTWNAIAQFSQNSTMTFTKSTQNERTAIVSGYSGTLDNSSSSGSGNISSTTYTFVTRTGVAAGTYSLKTILQNLINLSHNHVINKGVTSYNCNCNCNCDCDCGDTDS